MAHTHWRILFTQLMSGNDIWLDEVRFFDAAGEIPLQGKPIASSVYSSEYPLEQAFDKGTSTTGWASAYGENPAWIGYAFNEPQDVRSIDLVLPDESSASDELPIVGSLKPQYSDDGQTWHDAEFEVRGESHVSGLIAITIQRLALDGDLIQWGFVQYQPQNLSGDLLQLAFAQSQPIAGSLLDLAFAQQSTLVGSLIGLAFSQNRPLTGSLLQYGFTQHHATRKFKFKGSQTQGFGDFDIAVYIGGAAVPMCQFAQSMTISHGENESYLCQFVIRPKRDRKLPREIDLYRWYAQPIVVQAVSASETVQLYQGIVDSVDYDMQGALTIQCSDRREQQINALPHSTIAAIGYTSKAAHGDKFDTQKDELDKRLSTIPASFEFDAYGTPYLTPWQPKAVADAVLSPCVIYKREPKLSLASVGGVTNAVEVEVSLQHTRLLQRSHIISMDLGIGVCEYAKFGQLPDLNEINSAVNETGWTMWGFSLERVARTGWYNCDGRQMAWYRDGNARQYDDNGKLVSKSKLFNSDVVSGEIEMIKRWTQNIAQTIKLRVENRASIARYQEVKQGISFNVNVEPPKELDWDTADNPHADKVQYEASSQNRLNYPFFRQGNFPRIAHFQAASNGDWYADFSDSGGEWARTLQVAYHTAYTLILAAHRQNTVELEVKFMPHLDLRHTHEIQHPLFTGKAKVSHFTHTFNFETKLGQTAVQYRFFQNAENEPYTPFRQPENPAQTFPAYTSRSSVGKVLLPKGGEDEIAGSMMGGDLELGMSRYRYGMIYQRVNGAIVQGKEVEKYQALVLRFKAPDIEAASTDTRTLERKLTYSVGVPNDAISVRI